MRLWLTSVCEALLLEPVSVPLPDLNYLPELLGCKQSTLNASIHLVIVKYFPSSNTDFGKVTRYTLLVKKFELLNSQFFQ